MTDPKNLSTLLLSIRQGDEIAFRELYEHSKSKVFNLALGYVRSREDAEEIVQDVFVELFESIGSFKGNASLTTWIYRITVNKSLDFLKHQKRQKRFSFLTSLFDAKTGETLYHPTDFSHPGITLEKQEQAALLFNAIDKLVDKQKTAFLLTKIEGLSNIETAAVMAISVGAVESLLQRATDNLRKHLAGVYKSLMSH